MLRLLRSGDGVPVNPAGATGPVPAFYGTGASAILKQFELLSARTHFLPRQSGLCPRALVGAKRRVRRGTSLARGGFCGSRSYESSDKQSTLHVLRSERPTVTALLAKAG